MVNYKLEVEHDVDTVTISNLIVLGKDKLCVFGKYKKNNKFFIAEAKKQKKWCMSDICNYNNFSDAVSQFAKYKRESRNSMFGTGKRESII